ncbi:MAG TPA: hypothetical protein VF453_15875 [Burkholderiaceae bacterium]
MQISASQASPSAASISNAFPAARLGAMGAMGAMVADSVRVVRAAAMSLARPATLRWAQAQALKIVTVVAGH